MKRPRVEDRHENVIPVRGQEVKIDPYHDYPGFRRHQGEFNRDDRDQGCCIIRQM